MTTMLGGAMRGYWATGSCERAKNPPKQMTMDNTAAKIGRSMKKRENMGSLVALGRNPTHGTAWA